MCMLLCHVLRFCQGGALFTVLAYIALLCDHKHASTATADTASAATTASATASTSAEVAFTTRLYLFADALPQQQMDAQIGGLNPYALDFPVCSGSEYVTASGVKGVTPTSTAQAYALRQAVKGLAPPQQRT
eukprot:8375-Heterococcus_DN1.PRE.1